MKKDKNENLLQVTDVRVTPVRRRGKSNLVGLADISLNDLLRVRGLEIRVDNNEKWPRLYICSQNDRHFHDDLGFRSALVVPLNMAQRELIETAIFEEYGKVTGRKVRKKERII